MPALRNQVDPHFWADRRVLLTGHTGFKGAWTALWLSRMGAIVTGVSLEPETTPNLFSLLGELPGLTSRYLDIRDAVTVRAAVAAASPELVIHMAAQALVPQSYREPVATFAVNVMGTAHVLDALRGSPGLRAVLVVTSDKAYRNDDSGQAYREADPLGGDDPYSASKAATEMVVSAWRQSYLGPQGVAVGSARAGNVVGGGDWSLDRLIPDLWRAARANKPVTLRFPQATRPWQHVLEAIGGYLAYVQHLASDPVGSVPALNFGPAPGCSLTVAEVAEIMSLGLGSGAWVGADGDCSAEKMSLRLDPAGAWHALGWRTRLTMSETLAWTGAWYNAFDSGADMPAFSGRQIDAYTALCADTAIAEAA